MFKTLRRFLPRITIGTKLVSLIAALLMGSVVSLVWLSTRMFVESDTALIQQANADTAGNLATQMRELFQSTTEKMRILGVLLQSTSKVQALSPSTKQLGRRSAPNPDALKQEAPQQEAIVQEFFAKDKDFLAVYLEAIDPSGRASVANRAVSQDIKLPPGQIGDETWKAEKSAGASEGTPEGNNETSEPSKEAPENLNLAMTAASMGEVQFKSMSLPDGEPVIFLAIPFVQDPLVPTRFTHILAALMRQNKFVKAFSDSEVVTSFMVDGRGRVLAHPDPEIVKAKENLSNIPIVKELLSGKFNNGQTRYLDPRTGEARLGAFRVVGFGGLGVVAEVAEAKAFEGASKVVYRAALVAWIILCLSFLAGYLYSATITWPIRRLEAAAKRISAGDFNISLQAKGQDEIAHLSGVFNEMAKGLEERDRVKETFNKFHNKEIAEKLLSGEVKLGGERKVATVFFSDVRGFTSLSETMQPEQVVEMLNEYMTRMVAIIRSYKGIVDKYVGDAIMAIWGVPISTEEDCYNAVRACLEMRAELWKLNELRISRKQPVIKIGMGLNMGPLIAGNIGSDEKMEYTVIGDAVNLASRIESMTKEFGTDCLVSKSVYDKIQSRFIFEKAASTKVKGKTEAVEIFKVLGYINEKGLPVRIETPYSTYASEKSDKVVHEDHGPAMRSEDDESAPEIPTQQSRSGVSFAGAPPPMNSPPPLPISAEQSGALSSHESSAPKPAAPVIRKSGRTRTGTLSVEKNPSPRPTEPLVQSNPALAAPPPPPVPRAATPGPPPLPARSNPSISPPPFVPGTGKTSAS